MGLRLGAPFLDVKDEGESPPPNTKKKKDLAQIYEPLLHLPLSWKLLLLYKSHEWW